MEDVAFAVISAFGTLGEILQFVPMGSDVNTVPFNELTSVYDKKNRIAEGASINAKNLDILFGMISKKQGFRVPLDAKGFTGEQTMPRLKQYVFENRGMVTSAASLIGSAFKHQGKFKVTSDEVWNHLDDKAKLKVLNEMVNLNSQLINAVYKHKLLDGFRPPRKPRSGGKKLKTHKRKKRRKRRRRTRHY